MGEEKISISHGITGVLNSRGRTNKDLEPSGHFPPVGGRLVVASSADLKFCHIVIIFIRRKKKEEHIEDVI